MQIHEIDQVCFYVDRPVLGNLMKKHYPWLDINFHTAKFDDMSFETNAIRWCIFLPPTQTACCSLIVRQFDLPMTPLFRDVANLNWGFDGSTESIYVFKKGGNVSITISPRELSNMVEYAELVS